MRVTALINTYNYGRFVGEAIESVLAQDYPREQMEVIVVDDGSTDDTRERVARFGDRVRYIYKENGGQASALNAGIAASRGEVIALLDADDLWLPGKLLRVMDAFQRNPQVAMVYHPFEYETLANGNVWRDSSFVPVSGNVVSSLEALLRFGQISTSNMAFRRAAIERLLPIPQALRIYADSYLGYTVIFAGPIQAISEPLARYRIHGQNLATCAQTSGARLRQRHECFQNALAEIRAWLQRNGFDAQREPVKTWLARQSLVEQWLKFTVQSPGRTEFAQYLRAHDRLYAPLHSSAYRIFRAGVAGLAYVLGYEGYEACREWYRRARTAPTSDATKTVTADAMPAGASSSD